MSEVLWNKLTAEAATLGQSKSFWEVTGISFDTRKINKGDLFMIAAIISWGIYSAFLKKRNFDISLLALVQIICTFGLVMLTPAFLIELNQGNSIKHQRL